MTLFTAVLIFILGTTIGSFLSVIIHRLETNLKSVFFSRSVCPSCKKNLKWKHLIPVFSWLFLRGKCAYCRKKISSHYFTLELLTGFVFIACFLNWNFIEVIPSSIDPTLLNYSIDWKIFQSFIFYIIESSFLIAIFFYDLMHKEIPDKLSFPAMAIAIAGVIIIGEPNISSMIIGGAGIFTFFALQLVLSNGRWIGGGDLRLGALMGILLGWEKGIIAVIAAYIIGSLICGMLLAQKKVTRKSLVPFGPFLVTGTFVALFYGEKILEWYTTLIII